MTSTPVNSAATMQAPPLGGGTGPAGAGSGVARTGGAGFLSFLDQLFATTTAGAAQPAAAPGPVAGVTAPDSAELPPWLLAFSGGDTAGHSATDRAETASPKEAASEPAPSGTPNPSPSGPLGDDRTGADALLIGAASPASTLVAVPGTISAAAGHTSGDTAIRPTAAPQTTTGSNTTAPGAGRADAEPASVTHLASELAANAAARSGSEAAAGDPTARTPGSTAPDVTGDAELDVMLATLARRANTQGPGSVPAAAGHAEAEQLARAANPAAQGLTADMRPKGSDNAERNLADATKREGAGRSADTDPLTRLLDGARSGKAGAAQDRAGGSGAGAADTQAFKPTSPAPVLLTINEVGMAATGTGGTATQAFAATDATAPMQTARPNMETLAVRIAHGAGNGTKSFDIELDPPELGRVEVRLEFGRDGRVSTHLIVDRADTLDTLMRDARNLERSLQAQGFKLDDGGVQYQLRDQSNFAQHRQGGDATPDRSGTGHESADGSEVPTDGDTGTAGTHRQLALGGLDVRI